MEKAAYGCFYKGVGSGRRRLCDGTRSGKNGCCQAPYMQRMPFAKHSRTVKISRKRESAKALSHFIVPGGRLKTLQVFKPAKVGRFWQFGKPKKSPRVHRGDFASGNLISQSKHWRGSGQQDSAFSPKGETATAQMKNFRCGIRRGRYPSARPPVKNVF